MNQDMFDKLLAVGVFSDEQNIWQHKRNHRRIDELLDQARQYSEHVDTMWKLVNHLRQAFVELRLLKIVPLKELIEIMQSFDANVIEERNLKERQPLGSRQLLPRSSLTFVNSCKFIRNSGVALSIIFT